MTELTDTKDITLYFIDGEDYVFGVDKVVRRKGCPVFVFLDDFGYKGYIDLPTLACYRRERGLLKPPEQRRNKKNLKKWRAKKGRSVVKKKKKPKPGLARGKLGVGVSLNRKQTAPTRQRKGADHFPTPPECTQTLVNFLNLPNDTKIWEPAARM